MAVPLLLFCIKISFLIFLLFWPPLSRKIDENRQKAPMGVVFLIALITKGRKLSEFCATTAPSDSPSNRAFYSDNEPNSAINEQSVFEYLLLNKYDSVFEWHEACMRFG